MKALHFISGLPRSGSTMLAAVLRQNPRFHAAMTSPLSRWFTGMERAFAGDEETSVFVSEEMRDRLLRELFDIYYRESRPVVFDTSRKWCGRLPVLARLFPDAKIVCCVREIGWIADSFERLYRKNGMGGSGIYGWDVTGTVFHRTNQLMTAGVVGWSIDAVREAWASDECPGRMALVDYETMCREPRATLRKLYDFLGEDWFEHDFERVEYEAGEFDRRLGAEGLHTVTGAIAWRPRETILPAVLFAQYNGPNFWR